MNITEDETSLDMDWVASLVKRLPDTKYTDGNRVPTIYRVPDILKRVDPEAYEPLLVSLGPYHRNKPHLQAMNQLKWEYLKFVLEHTSGVTLVEYLGLIKKLEKQARDAYSEEVNMSSNSFAEMMLLDGCFVMLTIKGWNTAIISWSLVVRDILRDILMFENQLPFFLLETLYESAFPQRSPFRNLTVQFIGKHISSNLELPSNNETFHHIIHLFLSCIDPIRNHSNGNQVNKLCTVRDANPDKDFHLSDLPWIPSAKVCNEAGIRFKTKKRAKSFLDITFNYGKLQIPRLQIDDDTNWLLRNLIAYEQCYEYSKFHVTCYVQLMDYLIDTAADVELLQQHEIIVSGLGDSQGVATLFNKLGMHVGYDVNDFYLVDVVEAMRKHCNTRYSKWRARLKHDYFNNPWAVFTLYAFIFTVIQTIYAVLSYSRSSN